MVIQIKEVPVEAHNNVGKVERYHIPLQWAYKIIRDEIGNKQSSKEISNKQINKEMIL